MLWLEYSDPAVTKGQFSKQIMFYFKGNVRDWFKSVTTNDGIVKLLF